MTTPQIIILAILGVVDFYFTIIRPVYADKLTSKDGALMVLNFLKMLFIWALLVSIIFWMNEARTQSKGKCPEYEQIREPVYKFKI